MPPGREEVARIEVLQSGDAGAVVGHHKVDDAFIQGGPEGFLVGLSADGGAHL